VAFADSREQLAHYEAAERFRYVINLGGVPAQPIEGACRARRRNSFKAAFSNFIGKMSDQISCG
jgi:hypothetical protein